MLTFKKQNVTVCT